MSDSDYLRDLAQRLRHIAVTHGVDGGDVDRLEEISREVEQLTKERDEARAEVARRDDEAIAAAARILVAEAGRVGLSCKICGKALRSREEASGE